MTRQSGAHQLVVGIALNTTIQSGSRKGCRNYPIDFKKQLAIAACAPGVSVARLALDNGTNDNMLHKWRRACLASGVASEVVTRKAAPFTFVKVHITPVTNVTPVVPVPLQDPVNSIAPNAIPAYPQAIQPDVIEISLAVITLRLPNDPFQDRVRSNPLKRSDRSTQRRIERSDLARPGHSRLWRELHSLWR